MQRVMVAVGLTLGVGLLGGCGYDDLVAGRGRIQAAWTRVEYHLRAQTERSRDLSVVAREHVAGERTVLEDLADARAQMIAGGSQREKIAAATHLMTALTRLLALRDRHPALAGSPEFRRLVAELGETERQLAVERARYNDAVHDYNAAVERFPTTLLAWTLGFRPEPGLESLPEVLPAQRLATP